MGIRISLGISTFILYSKLYVSGESRWDIVFTAFVVNLGFDTCLPFQHSRAICPPLLHSWHEISLFPVGGGLLVGLCCCRGHGLL